MKKSISLFTTFLIVLLLSSCNVTFDGYYHSIDDARADEKIYSEYDFLFTAEEDDRIVDFVIRGERLSVSKIDCRNRGNKNQYQVKSIHTTILKEHVDRFHANNGCNWTTTSNFPYQVEICVVDAGFDRSADNFEYFKIDYNGTEYLLCYKIHGNEDNNPDRP